ncbi:MAG: iron-sulfur cluster assembly accessory protein [Leptolyngbya sp. SIO4C1]|nr:iron-sulfur cluster assembly accessory protein [Leptolyngbya sp. SIO4C1]
MIQLTPAAIREILRLQQKRTSLRESCFRLSVQPGSCADWAYVLEFNAALGARDRSFKFDGLTLAVAEADLVHLSNLRIDYSEDLMGGAFRFDNPAAIATCQCGLAFSTDDHLNHGLEGGSKGGSKK